MNVAGAASHPRDGQRAQHRAAVDALLDGVVRGIKVEGARIAIVLNGHRRGGVDSVQRQRVVRRSLIRHVPQLKEEPLVWVLVQRVLNEGHLHRAVHHARPKHQLAGLLRKVLRTVRRAVQRAVLHTDFGLRVVTAHPRHAHHHRRALQPAVARRQEGQAPRIPVVRDRHRRHRRILAEPNGVHKLPVVLGACQLHREELIRHLKLVVVQHRHLERLHRLAILEEQLPLRAQIVRPGICCSIHRRVHHADVAAGEVAPDARHRQHHFRQSTRRLGALVLQRGEQEGACISIINDCHNRRVILAQRYVVRGRPLVQHALDHHVVCLVGVLKQLVIDRPHADHRIRLPIRKRHQPMPRRVIDVRISRLVHRGVLHHQLLRWAGAARPRQRHIDHRAVAMLVHRVVLWRERKGACIAIVQNGHTRVCFAVLDEHRAILRTVKVAAKQMHNELLVGLLKHKIVQHRHIERLQRLCVESQRPHGCQVVVVGRVCRARLRAEVHLDGRPEAIQTKPRHAQRHVRPPALPALCDLVVEGHKFEPPSITVVHDGHIRLLHPNDKRIGRLVSVLHVVQSEPNVLIRALELGIVDHREVDGRFPHPVRKREAPHCCDVVHILCRSALRRQHLKVDRNQATGSGARPRHCHLHDRGSIHQRQRVCLHHSGATCLVKSKLKGAGITIIHNHDRRVELLANAQ